MPDTSLPASAATAEKRTVAERPPSLILEQNHTGAESSPAARPWRRREPTSFAPRTEDGSDQEPLLRPAVCGAEAEAGGGAPLSGTDGRGMREEGEGGGD